MLFLNIYESYKTLRKPPPSSRSGGRPSQRALTQRKRDMKGCLAVWIVWTCIITYEGYVEGLISLFVPFYDEFKSLALLFLIMTRARGAEPIFLNIIRPLVKPYSPTIDLLLDLARMVGDISFAVLAIPTEFVHACYKKSIFFHDRSPYSEADGSQGTTTPNSDAPSLKRAAEEIKPSKPPVFFPKKTSSDRPPSETNRRPPRTRTQVDQVGQRAQANTQSGSSYQIWYPPPSSYSDDEDAREIPDPDIASSNAMLEQKALDEWRQYPAFPSAYPPTPLVVSSAALPSTSAAPRMPHLANSLMLSEILEDIPQQDFSKSLLPPRRPLNPGFVGDLSDDLQIPGVPSTRLESMSVDSDSEDDDEEDIFNTTLQTPIPPLRATRSGIIPALPINREISMASSVGSRSTALTTNPHESPLRTHSSSESLSSDALSMSDLSSVLGKRPLPLDALDVNSNSQLTSGSRPRVPPRAARRIPIAATSRVEIDLVGEDTQSTFSTTESIDDRKPAHPKRRKVSQTPKRAAAPAIRPRIARYATAPTKALAPKPLKVPPPSSRAPAPSTGSATRRTESSVSSDATRSSSLNGAANAGKTTKVNNAKSVVKGKFRNTTLNVPSRGI
ncbi:hypothetical protein C0991_006533 [Blastosporella zonata]|nr:hypothetical protein C0991_006533 [Blastosporella zonata]